MTSFAQKMARKRKKRAEQRKAEERVERLHQGGLQAAWEATYSQTYRQMGPPSWEQAGEEDYLMVWGVDGVDAVTFNAGLAHKLMKKESRRSAVMALVENADAVVQAPRTELAFALVVPAAEYKELVPIEAWARSEGRTVRVFSDPNPSDENTLSFYVRSCGSHDWLGRPVPEARRPTIIIQIP